jgi:hypothetical protein
MFEINYNRLILLLLPTFLRKPVMTAFLRAMTAPAAALHDTFLARRRDNLYRLSVTPQACYLQRALNDAFSPGQRAIRIEDAPHGGQWVFACDGTIPDGQLIVPDHGGVTLWDEDTIMTDLHHFNVYVPAAMQGADAKIRAMLNLYKLVSKAYKIIYE